MRFGIRELIFFVVLLAVPVASFFYVFKPRNEEIRVGTQEITTKQDKLNMLAAVSAKIEDIGLAIEQGRDSIRQIEAKLPSEGDVEGILEQVWQIAKRNKLTVKSVKSQPPVPAALYMELPLKMVLEGEFDGFYQFLLELENLPRITRLHQMKLERAAGKGGPTDNNIPPGFMKADFVLSIYFEPKNQPSSAATPTTGAAK
jgi:type IV pilus assembly protein PilO